MGLLMRFLQPVDWLIAISDVIRYRPRASSPARGSGGFELNGTVTVEWFSSSKILMLVRAVP